MSISALATYTQLSPNCNKPRKNPISRITPHHMAGSLSLPQFGALVAKPSRQMSANYAIAKDGSIGAFCDEDNRSWCSSSPYNDHRAVTIEVANDGGASTNWHVSDAALESLVKLCVDICQRNPRAEKRPELHGRRARQPHQAQLLHGNRLPGQLPRRKIRVAGR